MPQSFEVPEYDEDDPPPGGPVFFDVENRCFVDLDGTKVCSKADALMDDDKWKSVRKRLRKRPGSGEQLTPPGVDMGKGKTRAEVFGLDGPEETSQDAL